MKAYKSIIRNNFIELGDIKDVRFKNVFREYLGVSVEKFENKLGKIDGAIDYRAFKIEEPKSIQSASDGFNSRIPFATPACINEFDSYARQKISDRIISLQTIKFEESIFGDFSTTPFQLEEDRNAFALLFEVEPQYDNHFIKTLKETYGLEWEFIYEKLLGFKRIFKVLLTLEQLIFEQENEQFQNAEFRLQQYEYFDLMFTIKKWENYFQVSFFNPPFYSSVTSNYYEKERFVCTSDISQ